MINTKAFNCFKGNSLFFTLKNKRLCKPVIVCNFKSSKISLDTMFALNETTERKTVKVYKYCGKPFVSANLKAKYCSPQFRNQDNVYKSRVKINRLEELYG